MPYPESCPECNSTFRNTGTHFTARRNEVGRHVLLELGCQTTTRRYWCNLTTGQLAGVTTSEPKPAVVAATPTPQPRVLATACAATVGAATISASATNGNGSVPRANGSANSGSTNN